MELIRGIHILGGSLLLVLGVVQLILPKRGKVHRALGQWYVAIMMLVCVTALYISAQSMLKGLTTGAIFLFSIGLFSLYGVISGYLLGKFKTRRQLFLGRAMVVLGVLISAMLLTIAFRFWASVGLICLPFGILQVLGTRQDWQFYWRLNKAMPHGNQYWIFGHSGRMIGSYIACVTAFLVNVVPCPYPVILWLGPTVVGTLCIIYFQRQLRKTLPQQGA